MYLLKKTTEIKSTLIMMYNRVPKCASTFVKTILEKACRSNHIRTSASRFGVLHAFGASQPDDKITVFLKEFAQLPRPILWSNHIHLPNFTMYGEQFPELINILRDPFNLTESHYYYIKNHRAVKMMWKKESLNLTLDECVHHEYSHCTQYNLVIPYFCGQDAMCHTKDRHSLARAKYNINR
jgi:hypothetical protein